MRATRQSWRRGKGGGAWQPRKRKRSRRTGQGKRWIRKRSTCSSFLTLGQPQCEIRFLCVLVMSEVCGWRSDTLCQCRGWPAVDTIRKVLQVMISTRPATAQPASPITTVVVLHAAWCDESCLAESIAIHFSIFSVLWVVSPQRVMFSCRS